MKKNVLIIIAIVLLAITQSCGPSITVTDMWKVPDAASMASETILVMARMDDLTSRQRFEQEIATQLRNEGIDAVESYIKYPSIKMNEKMSETQIDQQVGRFKSDGFEGIVLTVIKDVKTELFLYNNL